ncbi:MAG: hypothetical protein ACRCZY_00155 [Phocaeicola sp.]
MKKKSLFPIASCIALASFVLGGCSKEDNPDYSPKDFVIAATLPTPNSFKKTWEKTDHMVALIPTMNTATYLEMVDKKEEATANFKGSVPHNTPVGTPLYLVYPSEANIGEGVAKIGLDLSNQPYVDSMEKLYLNNRQYMWAKGSYNGQTSPMDTLTTLVSLVNIHFTIPAKLESDLITSIVLSNLASTATLDGKTGALTIGPKEGKITVDNARLEGNDIVANVYAFPQEIKGMNITATVKEEATGESVVYGATIPVGQEIIIGAGEGAFFNVLLSK